MQHLIPKNYINRYIQKEFLQHFSNHKITVLYGPRQVGKSSLVAFCLTEFLKKNRNYDVFSFNLDKKPLEFSDPDKFIFYIQAKKTNAENKVIVVIDEAQRMINIGLFVKYIYDKQLGIKFILTGSASLDIKEKIKEPLTGRKKEFFLSPLSFSEILLFKGINPNQVTGSFPQLTQALEEYMLFGGYPEVVVSPSESTKIEILKEISESYILRDLVDLFNIKNQFNLSVISSFLAENTTNLLSKRGISQKTGIGKYEVEKILNALDKTFVTWKIYPFSQNKFKELIHMPKIYFNDLGIRNAILGKLLPKLIITDRGKLFENAVALILVDLYEKHNLRFWRNINQTEVDFICLKNTQKIDVFEVKYKWSGLQLPKSLLSFINQYNNLIDKSEVITVGNFWKLLVDFL
ncbi:ATP-binding protein [Patescibacteria group bacterium]|nr:ATP-binding protein [Patescibacteria group bacterium]